MNRRGFLSSILVAAAAPAIVRADSLMRIVPMKAAVVPLEFETIILPDFEIGVLEGIRFIETSMEEVCGLTGLQSLVAPRSLTLDIVRRAVEGIR